MYMFENTMFAFKALFIYLFIGLCIFKSYSIFGPPVPFLFKSDGGMDIISAGIFFVCITLWIGLRKHVLSQQLETLKKAKEELTKEYALKKAFYSDSAHQIGNTLQNLIIPLEVLLYNKQQPNGLTRNSSGSGSRSGGMSQPMCNEEEKIPSPITSLKSPLPENEAELCKMSKISGKLIQVYVANVMDLRKVMNKTFIINQKNDNIKERLYEVYELFKPIAMRKKVTLNFEIDPEIPDNLNCDGPRIEQIFVSYINYALDRSVNGKINIKLKWENFKNVPKQLKTNSGGQNMDIPIRPVLQSKERLPIDGKFQNIKIIELDMSERHNIIGPKVLEKTETLCYLHNQNPTRIKSKFSATPDDLNELSFGLKPRFNVSVNRPYNRTMTPSDTRLNLPKGILTINFSFDGEFHVNDLFENPNSESFAKLIICRHIIEAMEGEISKSSPNRSAQNCLIVSLPVEISTTQAISNRADSLNPKKYNNLKGSVLYIEDNELNRKTMQNILEMTGINVTLCANGKDGLDMFCNPSNRNKFSCIITDLRMPIIDGWEFIQHIREFEADESLDPIPIIVLTGVNSETAHSNSFENCENIQILEKPVLLSDLWNTISTAIQIRKVSKEAIHIIMKKIMIMDDDPIASKIGVQLLKRLGCNGISQSTVKNAVECYKKHYQDISLIIQDNLLQDGRGSDCIRKIRKFEEKHNISPKVTVISVSGLSVEQQKEEYEGLDVSDFLVKPVMIHDFEEIISRYMK